MAVERTSEFVALLAAKGVPSPSASLTSPCAAISVSGRSPLSTVPETRSSFLRAASEVSHDLHSTSAKLGSLLKLVKKRGMFSDVSAEIDRLTSSVKLDMESLSSRLDILQGFVERQQRTAEEKGWQAGRSGDSRGDHRRGDPRGTAAAASSVPDSDEVLNSVQGLSHSGVMLSQMRGALLSFTSSLKGILHVRSGALKAQAERRAAFGGGGRELGRPVSMSSVARPEHADAIVHVGEHHRATHSDVMDHSPFAQLSQQQLTAVNDNSYLEARAADVRLIEGHMSDLAQMFTRLASVVSEQGAMVERIEDNLTASERDLESGLGELHRWKERVFSNRNLALRVVSILILFIFLFVIFGT